MKRDEQTQGLQAAAELTRFSRCGEEFFVLSYALPRWQLPDILTPAERDVVTAVLDGVERRELARHRGTSQRTIANLLARAFRKLGVHSRMELAAKLTQARVQR
jgi:DNA-binding CsgD family transcriptional regulator